jgi:hypothetical protein
MEEYKCINYNKCLNTIVYDGRGRKPKRCKECQKLYSKKLRRDAYRYKVKDKIKVTKCTYNIGNGIVCNLIVPYITNKPQYCIKHARKIRLNWMIRHYRREKVVSCIICGSPIKYETKKPKLCLSCRKRQIIKEKRILLNYKRNYNANNL